MTQHYFKVNVFLLYKNLIAQFNYHYFFIYLFFFQVSKELENENEELKAKIKALEEEGVQLKNKRISDVSALGIKLENSCSSSFLLSCSFLQLQILQEIHEQEMAKLESKLQSQTALAKHLHKLLLNR